MCFASELINTSKAFCTMTLNRLTVISHEDIDSAAAPWVVPFVATCVGQVPALYAKKPDNPGAARMVVANMVRVLCAAPKSRVADHLQAAAGLSNLFEKNAPGVPDFAFDKHTREGKRLGRGLSHFRREGALLINPDGTIVEEDEYADEAYRLWELLGSIKKGKK